MVDLVGHYFLWTLLVYFSTAIPAALLALLVNLLEEFISDGRSQILDGYTFGIIRKVWPVHFGDFHGEGEAICAFLWSVSLITTMYVMIVTCSHGDEAIAITSKIISYPQTFFGWIAVVALPIILFALGSRSVARAYYDLKGKIARKKK